MKRMLCCWTLLSVAALVFSPLVYADCGSDCSNSCSSAAGKPYEDCMVSCLQDCQKYDPPEVPDVPPPTPVEEPSSK